MIPFPKEIKAGGQQIKVTLVSKFSSKDHLLGEYVFEGQEIRIDTEIPSNLKTYVLLHELVHVWNTIWLSEKLDEGVVKVLAAGIGETLDALGFRIDWD